MSSSFSGMRVALVGPLPPPSGGMANQTLQLRNLLIDEGAKVELVQVNAPYRPAWIGRMRLLRAGFRLLPYIFALWRVAGRVQLVHVMANSGWAWHLFAAPAVWVASMRGTPVLVNYRGGEAKAFFARAYHWIKPTLKRAEAIVVPSEFLEEVFAKRGITARIVPNIVDLGRFQAKPACVFYQDPHLVVARNLEAIYDIQTALRAFAMIKAAYPKARLSVAGSGPLRNELQALAVQLGIADSVTFTGRLDNAMMASLYQCADLVLNPSLADNMPISILEALACGVPVVSTDVGGIPFLVAHEKTALLVPCRDARKMADAALRVLGDPALARALRQAGIALVARYTWPVVQQQLRAVYRDVYGAQDRQGRGL